MLLSPSLERSAYAAITLALLLAVHGLLANWNSETLATQRIYEYLRWSALTLVIATAFARTLNWRVASGLLLVWLLAHVALVGVVPVLSVALLALAALGIGARLGTGLVLHPAVLMLLGLALVTAVAGWLLPFPVHRMWWYIGGLAAIAYAQRSAIVSVLRASICDWQCAVVRAPRAAALAVMSLGVASVATWLPTMMLDDLSYHLALPTQLQHLAYYRMDSSSQVWANAPWASDIIQAIVQLMADRESRGSVNLLWLLAGASLLYSVCQAAGLGAPWCWIGLALYASLPLTGALLIGMQTELPATVVLLAMVWMVMRTGAEASSRVLLVLAVLAGLLLQLKVSMLLPLALMMLWMLWQWRAALLWQQLPLVVGVGVWVGESSYVYSWALTGNPVLPLYNQVFKSAYFSANAYFDSRFGSGFAPDLLWTAVVHTDQVLESWSMAGGWQHLVLPAMLPLALIVGRAGALTLLALVYLVTMYTLMHYLRYVYPALILLIPGLLVGLSALHRQRAVFSVAALVVVANLACIPNASWPLRVGAARSLLNDHGDAHALLVKYAPERLLVGALGESDRMLIVGRPYQAEFAGRAFNISWYDQELMRRVEPMTGSATTTAAVRELLQEYGFTHVMVARNPQVPDIAMHLTRLGAEVIRAEADVSIWRLPSTLASARDLPHERDLAGHLRYAVQ